nr:hypothetical protein [Tanacetum cinerariifolium]
KEGARAVLGNAIRIAPRDKLLSLENVKADLLCCHLLLLHFLFQEWVDVLNGESHSNENYEVLRERVEIIMRVVKLL